VRGITHLGIIITLGLYGGLTLLRCFIEKLPYENTLCFLIISTFINARNILIYITLSFTACGGARNTGSKNISEFVRKIYQIFLLVRHWSKRVT